MVLLTQVEAKMKAGGPLDAITRQLNEFQTTITEEQETHNRLYEQQNHECADEFSFRDREVADAVSALKEATETLDGCTSQNARAEGDLAITKQQLADNRSYLASIEDNRRRAAFDFETATTVYQAMTKAIDEALVILEEIWAGETSFVQLAKHANGMLKTAVKIRKAHLMAPVLAALAQMASSKVEADEGFLERVKGMLNNFREKVVADFQTAATSEDENVNQYTTDKTRLETTISNLENQLTSLEFEIGELKKCIGTQTGIINTATAKRDRNQRLLDDAHNLCNATENEYQSATAARKQELELLGAIRQRVEARFAQLSKGVTERGEQDEFTYTNQSEYETSTFTPSA